LSFDLSASFPVPEEAKKDTELTSHFVSRYLDQPTQMAILRATFQPGILKLPEFVQSIMIHNALKIFGKTASYLAPPETPEPAEKKDAEEEDEEDDEEEEAVKPLPPPSRDLLVRALIEMADLLLGKLTIFRQSNDLDVQERVCLVSLVSTSLNSCSPLMRAFTTPQSHEWLVQRHVRHWK
jgi:hypothetical protein